MTTRHERLREAALAYAARGWSVLPIEPHGKRPLLPWRELQQRPADASTILRWYERWPDANVGIVTGRVSQLAVLDIDAAHGGEASLAALQERHGALPPTVEALTGGGGRHLYFQLRGTLLGNRVGLWPGIDLRANGGCVVAPPSLHASGRPYAWGAGHAPGNRALARLPAFLGGDTPVTAHPHHNAEHRRRLVHEGVAPERRNDSIASLSGHLLWRGVEPSTVLELMLAWNQARCHPPLDDAEVERVVRSIGRLHEDEHS